MGHAAIKTTERYLHRNKQGSKNAISTLEKIQSGSKNGSSQFETAKNEQKENRLSLVS